MRGNNEGGRVSSRAALSPEGSLPTLLRVAQLVSDWLVSRSSEAEEALLAAVSDDVSVGPMRKSGSNELLRSLEGLRFRLDSEFSLVLGQADAISALVVMVEREGRWVRAGHFEVGLAPGGLIAYFEYHEDNADPEPEESALRTADRR